MLGHILDNKSIDSFQSAYMTGHSCKTVLLRVYYNDIVTSCLVLLDLYTAFHAIDHDILFYILDLYVKFGCSALRRIQSYFVIVHKEFKLNGIHCYG